MKFWQYAFLKNPPALIVPPCEGLDPAYSILLNFNGNNGDTTTADSSFYNHSPTMYGGAVISTDQSKFGGSSLYVPSTGGHVDVPYNDVFSFGTGDFTVELWYYPLSLTQGAQLIQANAICSPNQDWFLNLNPESWAPDVRLGFGRHCIGHVATSEVTVALNQWHHFAASRSSGMLRIFHNGQLLNSIFDAGQFNMNSSGVLRIGETVQDTNNYGDSLNGYINDVRITKGTALYISNFTPPTEQLSAASVRSSLLLHFDGANGDTFTSDSSGYNYALNFVSDDPVYYPDRKASISTEQTKFGSSSLKLEPQNQIIGNGSENILDFGNSDGTIEAWVYLTRNIDPGNFASLCGPQNSTSANGLAFGFARSIEDMPVMSSSYDLATESTFTSNSPPLSLNQWYHVAYVIENGNKLKHYLNGTLLDTFTLASTQNTTGIIVGNTRPNYFNGIQGYIDDLRIVKGLAVYSGPSFTVPTTSLPSCTAIYPGLPPVYGCTDPAANNYSPTANTDDNSCVFGTPGCTDTNACNYDPSATIDDASCAYITDVGCSSATCLEREFYNACTNSYYTEYDGTCTTACNYGCMDINACNYDSTANLDNGNCDYGCYGCTEPAACNYDSSKTINSGCDYSCYGCTDPDATNYNPWASIDDGSCTY